MLLFEWLVKMIPLVNTEFQLNPVLVKRRRVTLDYVHKWLLIAPDGLSTGALTCLPACSYITGICSLPCSSHLLILPSRAQEMTASSSNFNRRPTQKICPQGFPDSLSHPKEEPAPFRLSRSSGTTNNLENWHTQVRASGQAKPYTPDWIFNLPFSRLLFQNNLRTFRIIVLYCDKILRLYFERYFEVGKSLAPTGSYTLMPIVAF